MGMIWSLTTGATTAKPPTEEVTDTAGVRMPSAIVSAVAKRVYRGTIRKISARQHAQGADRMNMTHPNLERPSKFLQPRGSRHDRLAVTNDFNVLGEFAVVVGIPARVVSGKDLLIQGERTAFSFTRPEAQGEPDL